MRKKSEDALIFNKTKEYQYWKKQTIIRDGNKIIPWRKYNIIIESTTKEKIY